MQLFTNTVLQLPQLVLVREPELVKDVLNVLIGVVSATFSLNQVGKFLSALLSQFFFVHRGFLFNTFISAEILQLWLVLRS